MPLVNTMTFLNLHFTLLKMVHKCIQMYTYVANTYVQEIFAFQIHKLIGTLFSN